ncbi:MAG: peptide ABC transporter ATP-binding protein [Deltaproteobacteria bacterium CG2_30_63_29]|nr:MAG: peptide ABC transporter ATP-binding protein [Deltaproteobacteria bacterium CG2_30_63_29]
MELGQSGEIILQLKGLRTYFFTDEGVLPAVDGVSCSIYKGKTLGVVGESGCGKSVTALSILQLVPNPPGRIVGGQVLFKGRDLTKLKPEEMRKIRGNDIAMVFQEPMTSLNPVFTVGNQIMEAITLHKGVDRLEARDLAIEMLKRVGIPNPELRIDEYPHQLSGGMRQRVMIAMALSCSPQLLIADEPTTALDVTIQAQILDLLQGLKENYGMSILLITHDLGVVAEVADDVVVMYAGKVVEYASVNDLFETPLHPYTKGLFKSIPSIGPRTERLATIRGMVPAPLEFPSGCRFRTRCDLATEKCAAQEPQMDAIRPGHFVACHHSDVTTQERSHHSDDLEA